MNSHESTCELWRNSSYIQKVVDCASMYNMVVSYDQAEKLLHHVALVDEKNKVMNLTRITDTDDAIFRHIVDSLLFLCPHDCWTSASNVLDLGTGAGFPGIPLTVMTGCHMTLLDSVGKKVDAVSEFCKTLQIDQQTECIHSRAEELAYKKSNHYDIVVARAVAQLRVLVEYASPLLCDSGYLISSKGNISDEELTQACQTADLCGMSFVSRETHELPSNTGHREIIVFQKTGKPKRQLPRQNGMAKKVPLK